EEDDTWPAAGHGAATSAGTTPSSSSAPPPPPGAPPSPAGSGWVTPPQTARQARAQARAARRAERVARGERYGTTGGGVLGGLLVLLGVFFLVRQYLPSIDFNWFWPVVLVAVGALLLLSAIGRGPNSGGPG